MQRLLSDRLIRRRFGLASVGTVAVVMSQPSRQMLVMLCLAIWPVGCCEWAAARHARHGGRSALVQPAVSA